MPPGHLPGLLARSTRDQHNLRPWCQEGITPLDVEAGEYGKNPEYPDSRLNKTKIILGR
ncbi:hypothetical protein HispidOSU_025719 [Sigmodon hispidus]